MYKFGFGVKISVLSLQKKWETVFFKCIYRGLNLSWGIFRDFAISFALLLKNGAHWNILNFSWLTSMTLIFWENMESEFQYFGKLSVPIQHYIRVWPPFLDHNGHYKSVTLIYIPGFMRSRNKSFHWFFSNFNPIHMNYFGHFE